MSDRWIRDVIADLQGFARKNDLPVLAHHLETTAAIADAEIEVKAMRTRSVALNKVAGGRCVSLGENRRSQS